MAKKFSLIMLTIIFTLSIIFTGCTSDTTSNKGEQAQLDEIMSFYTDFNGSVLVAKGDNILLNKGYGKADIDKNIDNKPQTIFGIGSITTQFTATAIMMLQEKNLLNIQDTINKFIPDYPNGDKIKIYNLLTHTSGIPEYYALVDTIEMGKHTYTSTELIDIFKNKPLNFDVGTKYEYSNSNYTLLGYIVEKVSGMRYEDYIQKNIFQPLGMNNSGFSGNIKNADGKTDTASKAIGYSKPEIQSNMYEYTDPTNNAAATSTVTYKKSIEAEPTLTYAAGGIYSTVEDLYKWSKALNTDKLISKESLKEMFTPHEEGYGYGWFIDEIDDEHSHEHEAGTADEQSDASSSSSNASKNDSNDSISTTAENKEGQIVHHGGYLPGYSSFIIRDNTNNYVVILLSNKEHDERVMDLGYALMNALEE